jgi:hypothetical protein
MLPAMGEAEDRKAESDDLSGRREADRGSSESTVGEGEARRLRRNRCSHATGRLEHLKAAIGRTRRGRPSSEKYG